MEPYDPATDDSFEGWYGQLFSELQGTIESDQNIKRLKLLRQELKLFDAGVGQKIKRIREPGMLTK